MSSLAAPPPADLVLRQLRRHPECLVEPVDSIEDLLLSLPAFRPLAKHPSLRPTVAVLLDGFDVLVDRGDLVETADGHLMIRTRGTAL